MHLLKKSPDRYHPRMRGFSASGKVPPRLGFEKGGCGARAAAVGLLGGSFNPPHYGHLAVSRSFMAACGLDGVAWLITPRNPMKDACLYEPIRDRLLRIEDLIRNDPGIFAWDIEETLGTTESVQTVSILQELFPGVRFVWLMGADLLIQLPLWPTWRAFLEKVPIAVHPRPGYTEEARSGLVARQYAHCFLESQQAAMLVHRAPPALAFLEGEEHDISSTALRAERCRKEGRKGEP